MRGRKPLHDENDEDPSSEVRLDKWLWAARFFKTRSLAAEAIVGGKVQVNGERVKRARAVAPGDEISIRQGAFEQVVRVRALSARRGPASDASSLYEETTESRAAREKRSLELKSMPTVHAERGRPTKRDRREMGKWRDKW